jgi:hypothetical protein
MGQASKGYASGLGYAQDPYGQAPRTADHLIVAGGELKWCIHSI